MTPTKPYYKIGEVAEMVGVGVKTLHYWETLFDQLSPARVGNQRRYTQDDIEIVRRIAELMYRRGLRPAAAKEAMEGYRKRPPRRVPVCRSEGDALDLLRDITKMTQDEHILVRVEAIEAWLKKTDSQS